MAPSLKSFRSSDYMASNSIEARATIVPVTERPAPKLIVATPLLPLEPGRIAQPARTPTYQPTIPSAFPPPRKPTR